MSPLRWEVLVAGFVLAVPVLMLGLRGDLAADDVAVRVLWCLAAGWGAVALVRLATAPRTPGHPVPAAPAAAPPAVSGAAADTEPATP